ncbi:3-mercaptopyruvate sulfurtransferase [Proteus mirabilis]|uniref:3-mercaptopyruvate sulfurtransferase n=1 Tax=Proteus mirabilis TaxID=584 RepID=UPI001C2C0943|nr:3-mercaptopyruvate sulfurtransferase [Proteus mirabilis]MBU9980233.1 3-mercaptopyruvate sulfurtransferase [Proteus mirabilis]
MEFDYFVTPQWLFEHHDDQDLVIVDVSAPMPTQDIDYHQRYLERHIPGAHFFDLDEIADKTTSLPHMLPSDTLFSETLTQLGISNNTTVILYDIGNLFSAPRGWWTFTTLGCHKVRILAGGLQAWIESGFPLEQGDVTSIPALTPFVVKRHDQRCVNQQQVLNNITTKQRQIVDARSADRFYGRAPEPRPGLRGGHIPESKNVPWDLLVTNGQLKENAQLKQIFEQADVDLSQPIIVTCGSGMSAAILFLALAILGCQDIALYDGSWAQWGAVNTLPCVCV